MSVCVIFHLSMCNKAKKKVGEKKFSKLLSPESKHEAAG